METQLHSLSKIFTERLFRIPDYQRGYAWGEKQLKDFWTDIIQLEPGRNHYTGVLTLERAEKSEYSKWDGDIWIIEAKGFAPFYVVDGQQRLTTAIVLIQAIIETMAADQKINFTTRQEIQKKFIFESKDGGISRSYVFGYERDNPSYEYLKTRILMEQSLSSIDGQETIYTNNLEEAKRYFGLKLNALNWGDKEIIYKKVTQHLLFNIFTIEEDVEVCVAFETMNNRGKALSYLELLKNRLIFLSLKIRCDEHEGKRLRSAINECWRSIYHQLGRNKLNPLDDDEFLHSHFIIYFGMDVDSEIVSESVPRRIQRADYSTYLLERLFVIKNVLSDDTANDHLPITEIYNYVKSLQQSVEMWYKIFNPADSDFDADSILWLDKLNRTKVPSFAPLVMVFFQKEASAAKRVELLKALERYCFAIMLLVYRGSYYGVNHHLEMAASNLSKGKSSGEKILKEIHEQTQEWLGQRDFIKNLQNEYRSAGFYNWSGIRYFMYEYNLKLQESSKTSRVKIFWPEFTERKDDFVTIEHIMPQKIRIPYWRERFGAFTAKQRKSLRDSLGNLLPLSRPKNSSLQDNAFPDKVDGCNGKCVGYRYGSYAENAVSGLTDWNPSDIKERGLLLLEFMEARWSLQLGGYADKMRLLGLNFLDEPSLFESTGDDDSDDGVEIKEERKSGER